MLKSQEMPQLLLIDQPQGIEELIAYLSDKEYIAYDCETTGLTKRDQVVGVSVCAEEDKAYYVIIAKWNTATQTLDQTPGIYEEVQKLLQFMTTKRIICHNATFDAAMAQHYFNIRLIDCVHTDTMILAHLLNENRRVGLKELAREYFGDDSTIEAKEMKESVIANGGTITKDNYEMYKADPEILGKYGAKDAWLTYSLFYILVPELYDQGLDKFFYEDESMPLLRGPTYSLNTSGLQVESNPLATLKTTLQAECAEAKDFIYREIAPYIQDKYPGTTKKNVFNIGASQQLSWLLFHKLELEFNTLTDAGKSICRHLGLKLPYTASAKRDFIATCLHSKDQISQPEAIVNGKKVRAKKVRDPWAYIACDKKTLIKLAPKYKWIERLLEYQRKTKILTTYVEGIESRTKYGVVNPSFLQHGTTSGRYASRNPNFQNLPRDDKRIKACITARPGKVFVGADYSQLEPRVFAYYSQDKRLMEAFNGETDFYSVIGMEVYGKYDCTPQKEGSDTAFGIKYRRLRDLSKIIALASTYGATAHQLAPTTGKGVDDTQADMDSYFERFPGVKGMMLEAHKIAKASGEVVNLFGRPRRMPEALKIEKLYGKLDHAELPYEIRNILNLAVNHRIQSTGASIVNRAAIRFMNDCKAAEIAIKLVLQVHDSLIAECDEKDADNVSILLENAMVYTVELPGVPLEAVPKIGKNLSEM